jgi:hypothetical protein
VPREAITDAGPIEELRGDEEDPTGLVHLNFLDLDDRRVTTTVWQAAGLTDKRMVVRLVSIGAMEPLDGNGVTRVEVAHLGHDIVRALPEHL